MANETLNTIQICASYDRVFQLASETREWPSILPHYRWVRVIWENGPTRIVEMAARRSWWPVKWTSVQHSSQADRSISYRHVGGLTTGMLVRWSFIPLDDGVEVSIVHELTVDRPLVRSSLGRWIVGEIFVKHIADETLRHIKARAEAEESHDLAA